MNVNRNDCYLKKRLISPAASPAYWQVSAGERLSRMSIPQSTGT